MIIKANRFKSTNLGEVKELKAEWPDGTLTFFVR